MFIWGQLGCDRRPPSTGDRGRLRIKRDPEDASVYDSQVCTYVQTVTISEAPQHFWPKVFALMTWVEQCTLAVAGYFSMTNSNVTGQVENEVGHETIVNNIASPGGWRSKARILVRS